MNDAWKRKSLFDAIELQRGFDLPASNRQRGDVPVVASTSVVGSHNAPKVQGPGVVVGRSGSIGGAQWIDKDFWPLNTTLWVKDFRGNDPLFVYHLLKSIDFSAFNVGSGVPTLNRNHLSAVKVELPPRDEQRRIAGVLGALDDLIEVNRRLVSDLDASVRLLGCKAMAVTQGRALVPLTEIAEITKGYSYKSSELIQGEGWLVNLKNIGRSGTFEARGFKPLTATVKPHQIIYNGDVLVAQTDLTQDREVIARPVRVRKGTLEGRLVASLDLAIVRPKAPHTNESIFAILNTEDFRSHALGYCNGTTVLHMGARALPDYAAPSLTQSEIEALTARVRPLREAADALNIEISDLEATRDELLPLLMSGRVRVVEAVAA